MALEKTWRWFGAKDTVTLFDMKQMGVEGVVTSLYHIEPGAIWPKDEIIALRDKIQSYGMRWSVVESLPVAEGIKIGGASSALLIENYKESIRNLGDCGIDTVCYNFMPVLDWARTDLKYKDSKGCESMLFDYPTFAAFDIFILKRETAADSYPDKIVEQAKQIYDKMTFEEQEALAYNIIVITQAFIHGAVGTEELDYKAAFLAYLKTYDDIDANNLRGNLSNFLNQVVPVAEYSGVNLCVHPDDPAFPLLGLPRIVSSAEDLRWILKQNDSISNGLTLCTGSLSTSEDNDLVSITEEFADRIHFVHLRNTKQCGTRSFYESGHLTGDVDMVEVVKVLIKEQKRRMSSGRKDIRIPFRPDHGVRLLDDYARTANPGYPLIGRLKGLAEIDGLQIALENII